MPKDYLIRTCAAFRGRLEKMLAKDGGRFGESIPDTIVDGSSSGIDRSVVEHVPASEEASRATEAERSEFL